MSDIEYGVAANYSKEGSIHASLKATVANKYGGRDPICISLSLFRASEYSPTSEGTVIFTLENSGVDASTHLCDGALDDLCKMFQKAKRARNRMRKAHADQRRQSERDYEAKLVAEVTGGAA